MIPQRLVHVGTGLNMSFVMVGGLVLMRDRRYERVDINTILDDADRAVQATFELAGVEHYLEQPSDLWRSPHDPSSPPLPSSARMRRTISSISSSSVVTTTSACARASCSRFS